MENPRSQPEYPDQRIQRDPQIAEVLVPPTRCVLIGAHSAVDEQRRPAASCEGMFAVALVPPLWYAIMDRRTLDWAGGDFSKLNVLPSRREQLMRRYAPA